MEPTTDRPPTAASTPSYTSTESDDPLARFATLLAAIKPESLASLAIRVRNKLCRSERTEPGEVGPYKSNESYGCTVLQPPNCGSFNLLYTLKFSDNVKWIIRIPCHGQDGRFTPASSRLIHSDAMTMSFLRQYVSMPVPEIYDFDESTNNEVGVPYILMEFAEGFPVSEKWFDNDGPTPIQERRLRILDTVAVAMSRLHSFWFEQIGSLEFEQNTSNPTFTIGPCNIIDEAADFENIQNEIDPVVNFRKIGPFDTSRSYFETLLKMQDNHLQDQFSIGIRHLLKMMIQCIPPSLPERTTNPSPETFVLAHPDLDSQNVLVSENGTLIALIDWDNVHTVPRCIGYTRYPAWITRDWDPIKYGYGLSTTRPENSPEELSYYRHHYSNIMNSLIPESNHFSTKSYLFEAIWIAVLNPICTNSIVEKIFLKVFPENIQGEELYLYETVIGLVEDTLDKDVKSRILNAFQDLFAIQDGIS